MTKFDCKEKEWEDKKHNTNTFLFVASSSFYSFLVTKKEETRGFHARPLALLADLLTNKHTAGIMW